MQAELRTAIWTSVFSKMSFTAAEFVMVIFR
jgi:hypothetical protein